MFCVYCGKPDLTYKAQLVCNSSRVDPKGLNTPTTVVKPISVRLFDHTADAWNKDVIAENINNALIQSNTNKKIYTCFGNEFGDLRDSLSIIVQSLYEKNISITF